MGGYSALGRMRISPSIYCFATQTRKRITDPASSTKIDQGSTPPNASGPNINSPNTPYSRMEASCAESGCGLPLIEYMFMRICCLFYSEMGTITAVFSPGGSRRSRAYHGSDYPPEDA